MKKFQIVYEEQVEIDLISILSYYEFIEQGLGKRFIQEYLAYIKLIKKNPHIFQIKYDTIHTAPLKVFPSLIFYIVEENIITILAVLHSAQNPEKWPKNK